ncbi:hypothetical protein [Gordonibacter massiliensis (ex Traore et al. 2017)]|uniref:Toxin n=1 Tax=Gordonibacter massiliensis (ex Traore et al. 2017) TaxID=1841863 RepID=A0A842JJP8_9ACTN|nr:hypothetical protein [Gordonibacter massiliensis (ex Traore et al. 2017)]MBC2889320.1 hypothetical protein [Gordonibacter massiliensis (ex Traore et al. 2017)]MBX9035285.1 hypothetical protein [Gordonibacter massiliensis (ex Traore et al. 2017)]
MDDIIVHPHSLKHGLTEEDVAYAWNNFARKRPRGDDYWVALGFDGKGREVELVAAVLADGTLLLIHAKTPATKKFKKELGYGRR